jgi:hypothetical protein
VCLLAFVGAIEEHPRSLLTIFWGFGEAAEIMEPCQRYTKQVLNESKNRFA